MKKRIFILTIGAWLLGSFLFAQQLPLTNQYTLNNLALSPALAGTGDGFEIFGSYRNEWLNIPGAPETKMISANGPILKNMGLGGAISLQSAGIFENISASAFYAYHAKFAGGHTVSLGAGIGLLESRVNLAGAAGQSSDPVVANNADVTAMTMDCGFGLAYSFKNLRAGISVPRLISNQVHNEDGEKIWSLILHDGFHVNYLVSLTGDWGIDPTARILSATNAPMFYELAVPVVYKKKIWISPIYKKTDIALGIGGIPYSNLIFNYAYEFSSKGIMGESGGTHEITLGWRFDAKKKSELPAPDPKKPYIDWILK